MSAAAESLPETLAFPGQQWFAGLARLMNSNRARQEQLGYIDCVAVFTVTAASHDGGPRHFRVTFEEFSATAVAEVDGAGVAAADFALVADVATWRAMIESIAAGHGRPALEQSLNRLSHMGTPMKLVAADPLQADLYFRYNQSLQEFFNASAAFTTVFDAAQ